MIPASSSLARGVALAALGLLSPSGLAQVGPASGHGASGARAPELRAIDSDDLIDALGLVQEEEVAALTGRLRILENRIGLLQNQVQSLRTELVQLRSAGAGAQRPAAGGVEPAGSCTRCADLEHALSLFEERLLALEGRPLQGGAAEPPYASPASAPAPLLSEGLVLSPASTLDQALPLLASEGDAPARELRVRFEQLVPSFDFVPVASGSGSLGLDPFDERMPNASYRRSMLQEKYAFPAVGLELGEDFLIGATEVTNEQFLAVVHGGVLPPRSDLPLGYLRHLDQRGPRWREEPVRNLSWYEAVAFCEALESIWKSEAEGVGQAPRVRLPSELEWEYAAVRNAGAQRFYPWGNQPPLDAEGVPDGSQLNLGRAPGPVRGAVLDRTAEGVWDLAGSVSEWCLDPWQAERWNAVGPEGLAHQPRALERPEIGPGDQVCVRGGDARAIGLHWFESTRRRPRLPETRDERTGFRIVLLP